MVGQQGASHIGVVPRLGVARCMGRRVVGLFVTMLVYM
jgi:hypothetical protein